MFVHGPPPQTFNSLAMNRLDRALPLVERGIGVPIHLSIRQREIK